MAKQSFPDELTLLHNPRCSKSRAAKALLEERGVAFRERLYLENVLSQTELTELAQRLDRPPQEWIRNKEDAYKEAGLENKASPGDLLEAMQRFPILIERPILIAKDRAIVGRPPENILALLD